LPKSAVAAAPRRAGQWLDRNRRPSPGGVRMSVELTACSRVSWVATTRIPTRHADFVAHAYHDEYTGEDHVVLVLGDLADGATPPLVPLHSACLTRARLRAPQRD